MKKKKDIGRWILFSYVVFSRDTKISLDFKEIKPVHPKRNQSWILIGRTDTKAETPILWPPDAKSWLIWKDPDERLKAGGKGDDRGWDGWMASSTQWTWVWINFRSWWWTGKPGMLQSMGTWLSNWTEPKANLKKILKVKTQKHIPGKYEKQYNTAYYYPTK